MKMDVNMVAHYQGGSSDKVYMACLRWDTGAKHWNVLGKWGRRGKKLSSQIKHTGTNKAEAIRAQENLFQSKLDEGYVNVDSPSYKGTVTRNDSEIRANMEKEVDEVTRDDRKKEEKKIPLESERMLDPKVMVAVCVDNAGMEDRFDVGTSYVFETVQLDKKGRETAARPAKKGMVFVWDKIGNLDEYMIERFRFVKEE